MADFNGQPINPWSWVPPEWDSTPEAADPLMVGISEYSQGLPPPPPPPPPTTQRIGPNMPPIEETAGPTPSAQPAPEIEMEPDPLTVGATLDQIAEPPAPPQPDPWQADASPSLDRDLLVPGMEALGEKVTTAQGETLANDPLAYVQAKQDFLQRQEEFAQNELDTINRRDELAAERTRKARADAFAAHKEEMGKINQEWIALSQKPISPENWWSTRSGGQKFAAVLAAVVGGLVAGKTGGPNTGLDMIMKFIDRDIEAQKANLYAKQQGLQNRKGVLAEAYAMSGDEFRAEEVARAASYQRAIQELQTRAQQFDPKGAQALKHAETIMGLQQAQAKALANAEKASLDRAEKMASLEGKLLDNAGKQAKLSGVGGGAGGAGPSGKLQPAELAARFPGNPVPPQPMTIKEYGEWLRLTKAGQDLGAEDRKVARERSIPSIKVDGKPFEPIGTDDEVKALRNRVTGTRKVVAILDEALAVRTGWTSDAGNSEENQKLRSLMGSAKLAVKQMEDLGAITESDADLIIGLLGTDDFSQYKSISAAIQQARRNMINGLRIELVDKGLDPKNASAFDIPNLYENQHKETEGERVIKDRAYHDRVSNEALRKVGQPPVKRDPVTGKILFE